jgi:hypothetical protein
MCRATVKSFFLRKQALTMVSNRVARFFLAQHTKTGKIYQMTIKYTKWPQKIPNGCKIDQTAIK